MQSDCCDSLFLIILTKGQVETELQTANGSLEVISGFFDIFNVFPGHGLLNTLITGFFFLCVYIFFILIPKQ